MSFSLFGVSNLLIVESELETRLKALKSKEFPMAECLDAWQNGLNKIRKNLHKKTSISFGLMFIIAMTVVKKMG